MPFGNRQGVVWLPRGYGGGNSWRERGNTPQVRRINATTGIAHPNARANAP